jgi:Xaa-Pro aminopeptidase
MSSVAGQTRIQRFANSLEQAGVDAYLAWHPVNMGYLHGFAEGAHERFLTLAIKADGRAALICPSLSETQARRAGITNIRSWRDGEDPLALFNALADEWGLKTAIIAVDDEMPAHMLLRMQEALPAALFKQGQTLISGLMRVKDSSELTLLRKAAQIADQAYGSILKSIKPGLSELEVQQLLYNEMRALGGKPTFAIVATGPNSAEPHHGSDSTRLEPGHLVSLDFGCEVEGYQSDITRALFLGKAPDEAKKVYSIVYEAQRAGREAVRPGATGEAVDAAARRVIEEAGYGEFFVHRTGHGLGLRGHEDPYIVAGNTEPLEVGNVFSVEPGIYVPGRFGVRIENIHVVTENGSESLNEEPASELLEIS